MVAQCPASEQLFVHLCQSCTPSCTSVQCLIVPPASHRCSVKRALLKIFWEPSGIFSYTVSLCPTWVFSESQFKYWFRHFYCFSLKMGFFKDKSGEVARAGWLIVFWLRLRLSKHPQHHGLYGICCCVFLVRNSYQSASHWCIKSHCLYLYSVCQKTRGATWKVK